jgi:hypothetical protein
MTEGDQVLRRCARCRLLFEAHSTSAVCIVCGTSVEGLALPLPPTPLSLRNAHADLDSVPHEIRDLEPTTRRAPFDPPRRPPPRS